MTIAIVSVVVVIAILTALIMWAASLFKLSQRLSVGKVILSCVASMGGTILGWAVVINYFDIVKATPVVRALIGIGILYVVPAVVLMICLKVICDLTTPRSAAMALWSVGGYLLLGFLIALLAMSELNHLTNDYLKDQQSYMWVFVLLSGVMMWSGFMLGIKNAGGSSGFQFAPIQPMPIPAPPSQPSAPPPPAQTIVPSEPVVAWMVATTHHGTRQFQVMTGDNLIGRGRDCRIKIDWDDEVSRQHSLVQFVNRVFELRDLGSSNGTFLNGDMVRAPRTLQDGDRIRVGNTEMTFKKV